MSITLADLILTIFMWTVSLVCLIEVLIIESIILFEGLSPIKYKKLFINLISKAKEWLRWVYKKLLFFCTCVYLVFESLLFNIYMDCWVEYHILMHRLKYPKSEKVYRNRLLGIIFFLGCVSIVIIYSISEYLSIVQFLESILNSLAQHSSDFNIWHVAILEIYTENVENLNVRINQELLDYLNTFFSGINETGGIGNGPGDPQGGWDPQKIISSIATSDDAHRRSVKWGCNNSTCFDMTCTDNLQVYRSPYHTNGWVINDDNPFHLRDRLDVSALNSYNIVTGKTLTINYWIEELNVGALAAEPETDGTKLNFFPYLTSSIQQQNFWRQPSFVGQDIMYKELHKNIVELDLINRERRMVIMDAYKSIGSDFYFNKRTWKLEFVFKNCVGLTWQEEDMINEKIKTLYLESRENTHKIKKLLERLERHEKNYPGRYDGLNLVSKLSKNYANVTNKDSITNTLMAIRPRPR